MRWTQEWRTDVRGVIDKFQLYDYTLSQLRVKMRGAGSPCSYYRNSAITFYGTAPVGETKCYCWKTDSNQPDRTHFLCMGTGYLKGYQKYGYEEFVVTTTSSVTKDPTIITTGERNSAFAISSTTIIQATITTERFTLTRFEDVNRFIVNHEMDATQNRLKYYYSTDDVTWIEITLIPYTLNRLGNMQGSFSIPKPTTYIRFRIVLQKRAGASASPKFNCIRFRYRNQKKLIEIDPRYPFNMPAFLAAREQQTVEIKQGQLGWEMNRPLRWWTMPEADVNNSDIITFLQGTLQDQFYEIQNVTPYMHGPTLRVLHKEFQSAFIRDQNDILKIIDVLS